MVIFRLLISLLAGKRNRFCLFWFDLYFYLGYVIVPVLMTGLIETQNQSFIQFNGNDYSSIYSISVLITYILTVSSYTVFCQLFKSNNLNASLSFCISPYFLLVVGLCGLVVYIYSAGGILNLISKLYLIRNGRFDIGMVGVIFKKAAYFLIYYYFAVLYLYYNRRASKFHLVISLMLALSIAFLNGGRGDILNILLFSVLGIYWFRERFPWGSFVGFIVFFVAYIMYHKQFIGYFSGDDFTVQATSLIDIVRKILVDSYVFMSVSVVVAIESSSKFTYFVNFIHGMIFPLKAIGVIDFDTISKVNTFNIIQRSEAFTPPSMIGSFIYSLGAFGLVIGAVVYGVILALIQRMYRLLDERHALYYPVVIFLIFSIQFLVVNSDFTVFVFRNILLLALFILTFRVKYHGVSS